jgi:hypothetical protein
MTVRTWKHPSPLGVFVKGGMTGSGWAGVVKDSITTFNDLMSFNGVKVRLAEAADENTAHIIVEAVSGQASFSYMGASYSKAFDGTGLHGSTVPVTDQGLVDRMFVFVPLSPRVDPTNKKSREVGREARRFLMVHEFIHAAGLTNDEHTLEDVFCYPGEIVAGSNAAADRIQPWGGLGKPAPPYTIVAKTITNLQKSWP